MKATGGLAKGGGRFGLEGPGNFACGRLEAAKGIWVGALEVGGLS